MNDKQATMVVTKAIELFKKRGKVKVDIVDLMDATDLPMLQVSRIMRRLCDKGIGLKEVDDGLGGTKEVVPIKKVAVPLTREEYSTLTDQLNKMHGNEGRMCVPMFPPQCPNCGSLKVTHVVFSSNRLECLDCRKGYKMEEDK